ncbi:tetratricopeptide repeat protein [Fibrella aquatica]|uniref:tetratricopeptide repeat protein n=1 Tax=Fibrella aquatica TaxID=3242487 RepID=UPI0035211EC0
MKIIKVAVFNFFWLQAILLLGATAGYGQKVNKPIISEPSLKFLSQQICECLNKKQLEKTESAEALKSCFEDEFTEHGEQILSDNNLEGSTEVGQQIGLLLSKELSKDCASYVSFLAESPQKKLINEAEALQRAGKHEQAMNLFTKLMKTKLILIDWTIYNQRGLSKLETGDYYGALADFEYAIQRDSTGVVAYNNRGLAKYRLGDKRGAFDDFTSAIDLDSTLALAYENRGVVLYDDDQYDRAKVDLLKAIALNPSSMTGYYYLGLSGKALENYSDTTAGYFTKAIELAPVKHEYQNARGLFYNDKKDFKRARADYAAAIKLSPNYNPAFYNLAQLDLSENKLTDALRNLDTAIRLDSTYEIYFNKKAQVLLQLKRYNEALASCKQAIDLNPERADSYDTQGAIFDEMGDAKNAVVAYTKSLDIASQDGHIYYRRGMAKLKVKDAAGACQDFQMGKLLKNTDASKAAQQHCNR